jgi:hypothetical protein
MPTGACVTAIAISVATMDTLVGSPLPNWTQDALLGQLQFLHYFSNLVCSLPLPLRNMPGLCSLPFQPSLSVPGTDSFSAIFAQMSQWMEKCCDESSLACKGSVSVGSRWHPCCQRLLSISYMAHHGPNKCFFTSRCHYYNYHYALQGRQLDAVWFAQSHIDLGEIAQLWTQKAWFQELWFSFSWWWYSGLGSGLCAIWTMSPAAGTTLLLIIQTLSLGWMQDASA